MTEVLSQDEIDQLLNAISSGSPDAGEEITQATDQKKIKLYDFKRPDKFSKEQIRTVQNMHDSFARLTTSSLSAQLRCLVDVKVASVDQLTYEEFTRSIPTPTALGIINMDPLKGSAILEIDPGVTFAIVDRLFGGPGQSTTKINRELTDIESSVMEGIIVRILGNMREAWSQIIDLRPRLSNIDTNPQFIQIVPPNEMVILVTLEIKITDKQKDVEIEGMMNFCIPYLTIEPIIGKLSTQFWYSSVRRGATTENLTTIKGQLTGIPIPLVVELGRTELHMADVLALRPGDIIRLPNSFTNGPMVMNVVNRKKYHCRPGLVGNRVAVQITKILEDVAADIEELADEGDE